MFLLTDDGIIKCEQMLNGQDLYDPLNPWAPYILNAIKAKELFIKDVHYIVKDKEIIIVDELYWKNHGRTDVGDGLHQSIEAKDDSSNTKRSTQTLASIIIKISFLYPNFLE